MLEWYINVVDEVAPLFKQSWRVRSCLCLCVLVLMSSSLVQEFNRNMSKYYKYPRGPFDYYVQQVVEPLLRSASGPVY